MKQTKFWAAALGFAVVGTLAVGAQSAEMANVNIVDGTIPTSLTGAPGNAENGLKVVIHRKKGNCLACHQMPIPKEEFHGKTAPDLAGIGARMSAAEMRMRLVDPKVVSPDTMMPSFYKTDLHRVSKAFVDKTILEAQEVEDVIAYLQTLK
jgi:sulfur-oxidizing protein SoxX